MTDDIHYHLDRPDPFFRIGDDIIYIKHICRMWYSSAHNRINIEMLNQKTYDISCVDRQEFEKFYSNLTADNNKG